MQYVGPLSWSPPDEKAKDEKWYSNPKNFEPRRTRLETIGYIIYKIFRIIYVSTWFYFMPMIITFMLYILPAIEHWKALHAVGGDFYTTHEAE